MPPTKLSLIGNILLLLIFGYWIYLMLILKVPYTFIDNVNLLFHEAGHLVFSGFGEFTSFLGGTLMQLLVPTVISCYFAFKQQYGSMCFGIFWFGENLVNISYYIGDANMQVLPLVGGIHDWHYLLSRMHLLAKAESIGAFVFWCGIICMTAIFLLLGTRIFEKLVEMKNLPTN